MAHGIEFSSQLEDAHADLVDAGETPDHDIFLLTDEKTPEEAAEIATDVANATRQIVLLQYDGYAVTVLPGTHPEKIREMIYRPSP